MKTIIIKIKGQIEDDVPTSEIENAIIGNLPMDFESVYAVYHATMGTDFSEEEK